MNQLENSNSSNYDIDDLMNMLSDDEIIQKPKTVNAPPVPELENLNSNLKKTTIKPMTDQTKKENDNSIPKSQNKNISKEKKQPEKKDIPTKTNGKETKPIGPRPTSAVPKRRPIHTGFPTKISLEDILGEDFNLNQSPPSPNEIKIDDKNDHENNEKEIMNIDEKKEMDSEKNPERKNEKENVSKDHSKNKDMLDSYSNVLLGDHPSLLNFEARISTYFSSKVKNMVDEVIQELSTSLEDNNISTKIVSPFLKTLSKQIRDMITFPKELPKIDGHINEIFEKYSSGFCDLASQIEKTRKETNYSSDDISNIRTTISSFQTLFQSQIDKSLQELETEINEISQARNETYNSFISQLQTSSLQYQKSTDLKIQQVVQDYEDENIRIQQRRLDELHDFKSNHFIEHDYYNSQCKQILEFIHNYLSTGDSKESVGQMLQRFKLSFSDVRQEVESLRTQYLTFSQNRFFQMPFIQNQYPMASTMHSDLSSSLKLPQISKMTIPNFEEEDLTEISQPDDISVAPSAILINNIEHKLKALQEKRNQELANMSSYLDSFYEKDSRKHRHHHHF